MARIDFYVLQHTSTEARLDFAVKLSQKGLGHQLKTLIWLDNHDHASALDTKLWQMQPESYLPHALAPAAAPTPPIMLAVNHDLPDYRQLLINLHPQPHPHSNDFERLAEIVTQQPAVLAQTRANYRHYQALGHKIFMHNL